MIRTSHFVTHGHLETVACVCFLYTLSNVASLASPTFLSSQTWYILPKGGIAADGQIHRMGSSFTITLPHSNVPTITPAVKYQAAILSTKACEAIVTTFGFARQPHGHCCLGALYASVHVGVVLAAVPVPNAPKLLLHTLAWPAASAPYHVSTKVESTRSILPEGVV